MNKIKIINTPTNAKLVKIVPSKDEQTNKRIETTRKEEGRTYIKARHFVAKILVIVICLFGLSACNKKEVRTLDDILKEDNYIIVDVRTKEEYNDGHVEGSINIPYDQIDKDTKLDKNKTILVYCKSGVRSNKAYTTLKNLGYDVFDLGAFDKIELNKE